MKSCFDYILESLINAKELNDNLELDEIRYSELRKILDTDDYKHGKVLGLDNINDMDKLFLIDYANQYTINYKDNIIGIFSIVLPNNLKRTSSSEYTLRALLDPLIANIYTNKQPNENIFKNEINNEIKNNKDLLEYINQLQEKNTDGLQNIDSNGYRIFKNECQKILEKSCYVVGWAFNQNKKKELDINDFALVKVFFNGLVDLCKEMKIDYIFAHGKDERTVKMYTKLGGFIQFNKTYEEFWNNKLIKYKDKDELGTKSFVCKKIS